MAAKYAQWAYTQSIRSPENAFAVENIDVGHVQFSLVGLKNRLVIAIAGTNEPADWRVNSNLETTTVNKVGYHKGFYYWAEIIAREIANRTDWADIARNSFVSTEIYGHSAGAAVAGCLPDALRQLDIHPEISDLITFAGPRFVRSDSAINYIDPLTRCWCPLDFVPDVPMHVGRWLPRNAGGWSHVGQDVCLIRKNGTTAPAVEVSAAYQLWRRLYRTWKLKRPSSWADLIGNEWHGMGSYLEYIYEWNNEYPPLVRGIQ